MNFIAIEPQYARSRSRRAHRDGDGRRRRACEGAAGYAQPDHGHRVTSRGRIPAARRAGRPRDEGGAVGEYPDAAQTERSVGFAPQSRPPNADSHENTDHNVHHGR